MADQTKDETQEFTPPAPDGSPAAPLTVILANPTPLATAPVIKADGLDEIVPGGRYIVGGEPVDAEGRPVKGRR